MHGQWTALAHVNLCPAALDKTQLRRECSKHMYKIRSPDGRTVRNMDWIYRNIPGAKVLRRTHQSLSVPRQPGQRVYQTLVDIEVCPRQPKPPESRGSALALRAANNPLGPRAAPHRRVCARAE